MRDRTTSISSSTDLKVPQKKHRRKSSEATYMQKHMADNLSRQQVRPTPARVDSNRPTSSDPSQAKAPTPALNSTSQQPASASKPSDPSKPQLPGSAYPAYANSTIDVNANPVHPQTGKPVLSTDLDADFPGEDDKPWRLPGTDLSDYFNYGFDEFTWASYCLKQQETTKEVKDQKKQLDDMQSFLTGGPGMMGMPAPPVANAPQAQPQNPAAAMGMPDMNPEMMNQMFASMMAQGLDPSSMDPMSFMQHAQAMMGQPPQPQFGGQGQQGGFGGGGFDHNQGQGGGGYGGNRGGRGGRRGGRW